jgi:hypothetical protein
MTRCGAVVLGLSVMVLFAAGCSSRKEKRVGVEAVKEPGGQQEESFASDLSQRHTEMLHRINSQRARPKQPPVPSGELLDVDRAKELLPGQLLSMQRKSLSVGGEKMSHLSTAEIMTRYERDSSRSVQVAIIDLAGMMHLSGLPVFPWFDRNIDEKTETGHAKTLSLQGGQQGYEEYDGSQRSVFIQILLNRRILVEIQGQGVDSSEGTAIVQALPLEAMAALAKTLPGEPGYIDVRPAADRTAPDPTLASPGSTNLNGSSR